jgi:hypothetical protein
VADGELEIHNEDGFDVADINPGPVNDMRMLPVTSLQKFQIDPYATKSNRMSL